MENLDNSIINKSEDDLDGGLFVSKADIHIDDDSKYIFKSSNSFINNNYIG